MASDCVSPAESARPDAAAERAPLFRRPRSVAAVPMVFLGLGLYRAWIEIVFVGTFVAFPAATVSARDLFDWTMVATALGCALLARRIGPFFDKRWPFVLGSAMLVASTTLMFASCWVASLAAWAGYAAAVAGGFGIALVILTWSELYGCLNPLRVALYYSASIVAGAVVLYAYRGFMLPWLFVMTALLPPLSFWAASRGFAHLPPQERPATAWTRFSVPWKAVLFMAAYAFGYGLMENGMYGASSALIRRPGPCSWRCSCSSASLSKAAASTSRLSTGSRCPSSWPRCSWCRCSAVRRITRPVSVWPPPIRPSLSSSC